MKPGLGFTPNDARFPFIGMDVNTPPAVLLPGASPSALNSYTFRGSVLKRRGYAALPDLANIKSEPILRFHNFQRQDGVYVLIAFTPTTIQSYDGTSWTDRTPISPWTGDETNFIDVADGVDTNLGRITVCVNGNAPDVPLYWDGIAAKFIILPINLTGFVTAKVVAVFNEYLIFVNLITTSDNEPRTAVWSDTGLFTEWLSGNAGQLNEMNFDGEVIRAIPYATNLVLFSRNSIGCLCYIDPNVIFGNTLYLNGIKLVAPGAVAYITPYILFAGQDNFYIWDGTRVTIPFGDKIQPIWSDPTKIDGSRYYATQVFHDYTIDKIRFILPSLPTGNRYFTMEIENLMSLMSIMRSPDQENLRVKWHETTPGAISCYGMYVKQRNDQDFSYVVLGNESSAAFVEGVDSTVFNDDNGSPINFAYQTSDMTVPQIYRSQFARWLEFEFEASGVSIAISYSIDGGVTWMSVSTVALTSVLTNYKVFFDITSRIIRFKFSDSTLGSTFELAWFRAWFRPGGAR